VIAWLIPRWTAVLETVKISLTTHDVLEESITMRNVSVCLRHSCQFATMLLSLITDVVRYLWLCLRPSPALAAENLFLRKQLALYQERQAKPRQATMPFGWHWFGSRAGLTGARP